MLACNERLPSCLAGLDLFIVACEGEYAGQGMCRHQQPLLYSDDGFVLQASSSSDLFDRETERSFLLTQLEESMLVILGLLLWDLAAVASRGC